MGDFQVSRNASKSKLPKADLVASSLGSIVRKATPLKHLRTKEQVTSDVLFFLVKVAALETIRRFSKAKCPIVWRSVQTLPVLSYIPFKWIQRFKPLQIVVRGAQMFARPLLVISVASALSNHPEDIKESADDVEDSTLQPDSSSNKSLSCRSHEGSPNGMPENWLIELFGELRKLDITLPERINEDEIRRFHVAANGDLSCLLSSLKKNIQWRESYKFLSLEELEKWSHLVFWHGCDMMLRPCLVIRLGLAIRSLKTYDRTLFVQAIVSRLEQGVLHLVNEQDPRITVLLDCEGLTPFRFPMHVLRSCSTLIQENYPTRLSKMFIIRLPPIVRVIAQTFFQVLKPSTRQKMSVEGEAYQKTLADFLQSVPAFLGGNCSCSICQMIPGKFRRQNEHISMKIEPTDNVPNYEVAPCPSAVTDLPLNGDGEHILRTAVLAILTVWIIVALTAGMRYSDSLASLLKDLQ